MALLLKMIPRFIYLPTRANQTGGTDYLGPDEFEIPSTKTARLTEAASASKRLVEAMEINHNGVQLGEAQGFGIAVIFGAND